MWETGGICFWRRHLVFLNSHLSHRNNSLSSQQHPGGKSPVHPNPKHYAASWVWDKWNLLPPPVRTCDPEKLAWFLDLFCFFFSVLGKHGGVPRLKLW